MAGRQLSASSAASRSLAVPARTTSSACPGALRPRSIGNGCAGDEWPAWCTCRLSRSGFGITVTLEAVAGQEELEALFDRVLNAQTVVDLKKPPA
jgi:hypothetical protein